MSSNVIKAHEEHQEAAYKLVDLLGKISERIFESSCCLSEEMTELACTLALNTSIEIVRDISDEEIIKLLMDDETGKDIAEESLPSGQTLYPICIFIGSYAISRVPLLTDLTYIEKDDEEVEYSEDINNIFIDFWKELEQIDKLFPNTEETLITYEP